MKALCVKQPWAELIASGQKTSEMRTWSTNYRGPVLILASAQRADSPSAVRWQGTGEKMGGTICIAELTDVKQIGGKASYDSDAACCVIWPHEFAWELRNVQRLPFVPVKGRLGLFAPPREWLEELGTNPATSCPALRMLIKAIVEG